MIYLLFKVLKLSSENRIIDIYKEDKSIREMQKNGSCIKKGKIIR